MSAARQDRRTGDGGGGPLVRNPLVIAALAWLCAAALAQAQPRPDRPCLTTPGAGATINNCTPTATTPTPTFTSTPTLSPSQTGTPTLTATRTFGPSNTPTGGTPTATRTGTTPSPTATGTSPTPTGSQTASPTSTVSPTRTPTTGTPTHTYTPSYTYTPTYTKTPSRTPTCYYEGYCTPTDTPTLTPSRTPTPTVTPTPECEVELTKPDNKLAFVANGGIFHFMLTTKGCQGKKIVLTIKRTGGTLGDAVFVDSNAETLILIGDVSQIVKIRTGDMSDVANNMEIRAAAPNGTSVALNFTNFWTFPFGQYTGPVPPQAKGALGPLAAQLRKMRKDGANQLGIAEGTSGELRGFALFRFGILPTGIARFFFKWGGPTNGFDAQRLRTFRAYQDGCIVQAADGQSESSMTALKSLIPAGEVGYLTIYDLDGPSLTKTFPGMPPPKQFVRNRSNFLEWSTYTDDDGTQRRASDDFPWFFRASWRGNIPQGVPGDNEVGDGTTLLTYDLKPPVPGPNFTVDSFRPQSASNAQASVQVDISGQFPDIPGDTCKWFAYLLAAAGDPLGDPHFPTDAAYIPASSVVKQGDVMLTATFPLQQGGLPIPAKDYRLYVVRGVESKPGPGFFTVTEDPVDHWIVMPADQQGRFGENVTIVVHPVDANDHIVTRPGKPRPSITIQPNAILNPPGPVMGADGEYYVQTTKTVPRARGNVVVNVVGDAGTPASTLVPIR